MDECNAQKLIFLYSQMTFEQFARIMGVTYFKRYWVTNGSYWNKKHIKKDNHEDLENIIRQANSYSHEHRVQFANQAVLFFLLALFDATRRTEYSAALLAVSIYHSYAFMVHEYNRRLARRALARLPPLNEDNNDLLKIGFGIGQKFFHVYDARTYTHYGPNFVSRVEAEEFKKYIELNVKPNQYFTVQFLDGFKQLYLRFISRIVVPSDPSGPSDPSNPSS